MQTSSALDTAVSRRSVPRLDVRCRAKIRIAKRAYAGFAENISEAGARIVTLTPIREVGPVQLTVPDLPPMWGEIRWSDVSKGGVRFHLKIQDELFSNWLETRDTNSAKKNEVRLTATVEAISAKSGIRSLIPLSKLVGDYIADYTSQRGRLDRGWRLGE